MIKSISRLLSSLPWREDVGSQRQINASLVILRIAAIVSYSRGFWIGIQGWGIFNFYVDYSFGFIKRGLVGTIFQTAFPEQPLAVAGVIVGTLHTIVAIIIGATLVRMARQTLSTEIQTSFLIWLLLATSQFPATLAYNTGYLDIFLFSLLLMAVLFWVRGAIIAVAAIGIVGPFIHEMFLFLWLVVICLEALRSKAVGISLYRLLSVVTPFASTVVVLLLHSQGAVTLALQNAPVSYEMRTALLEQQFGQTLFSSLKIMLQKFADNSANVLAAFLYYLAPTFGMIMLATVRWRSRHPQWWIHSMTLAIAALSPCLILLVAWDLSRFLVMTSFCAGLAFWAIDQQEKT